MRKLSIYLLALLFSAMMIVACDDDGGSNTTDKDPVTDTDIVNPDDDTVDPVTDSDVDPVTDVDPETDSDVDPGTDSDPAITDGVIEKIQSGEIAVDTAVEFAGVVTGVLFYEDKETHDKTMIKGVYVCNADSACVLVFIKAGVALETYKVGDAVEVAGTVIDYNGQKEISDPEITITGDGTVPTPLVVNPAEVSTVFVETAGEWGPGTESGAKAEQYRGRLIKVKNVTVTNANMGHGIFEVTGNLGIAKNVHYYSGDRTEGTSFSSIIGILDYSFSAFTLNPRSDGDFTVGSEVPETCGNGTLDAGEDCDGTNLNEKACTDFSFTGGTLACSADCTFDKSACEGSPTYTVSDVQKGDVAADTEVSLSDLVIISPIKSYTYDSGDVYSFYVADPAGGDYSGLFMYKLGGTEAPAMGDKVDIAGVVAAYEGLNQLKVSGGVGTVVKTGTAVAPEAVAITVESPASVDAKYKGSLVTVTGAGLKVTALPTENNHWVYELENGMVIYGSFIDNTEFAAVATVDAVFTSVTAIYDYQYGLMRLIPIAVDGMVIAE